jgi:putative endonuclease
MFSLKRKLGNSAEKVAKKYLIARGLKLIDANFLTKLGEIDLIMFDGDILVFIEVRYRTSDNFGLASATVNYTKQQKIIKTAHLFMQKYPKYQNYIYRFDVIGISGSLKYPDIDYLPNAF